jgi:undecaprenyl-diphosphatase
METLEHGIVPGFARSRPSMDTLSSIFLGIIQGLTEFLPISSSGHLVLFQNLLGFKEPELLLDASLHLGTLVSICIYLRSELKDLISETWKWGIDFLKGQNGTKSLGRRPAASLALMVGIGTLPTALIGLLFRSSIEGLFASVSAVGYMLLLTGVIVAVSRLIPELYNQREEVGVKVALAVGTAQALALIPGISRSGVTIVCGLLCGLRRETAARFSFLLAIPAIIGATAVQLGAEGLTKVGLLPLLSGFIASAIMGLAALKILMGMVKKGNLAYFAPYCWALGLFIIWHWHRLAP